MKKQTIAILIIIVTSLWGEIYLLPHMAKADDASCITQLNQPLQAEASSSIEQLEANEGNNIVQAQKNCAGQGTAEEAARRGMGMNTAITSNLQETCNNSVNQNQSRYEQAVAAIESQLASEEANNAILCSTDNEPQAQGPSTLFPPVNLSANPVSSSEISLSWTQMSNGGNFVYRNGNLIGQTNGTTYLDSDLAPNTTYTYTISTFDTEGSVSTQSNSVTATTLGVGSIQNNPIAPTGSITQNLQIGDSGTEVVALQTFLKSIGYLSMPLSTTEGYFGSLTKEALATFQLATGLPNTGYCGALTRAMIGEVEASESPNAN